ncbi:NAD(P)H-dependent oxidoreductase [Mucilaginibacter sp. cycad4]|uniref:FMN-dependent NADH-azoreductase n=1 Tax=Mucilaginibacter sp. cycad4 TaxID=3342096 RepID=UPI002AAAB603|nr:NAD(P)H-dependent oxidoreductase [Mucilaginibacter gossypii]WPU99648.1 NAD(P)H-dependent oxidoreductase [Mucilaginibacter gossypii]
MKKVLVINASARTAKSQSRKLSEAFVNHWKGIHANPLIKYRELGAEDVPHINENWIAAAFKPETERSEVGKDALKISDVYISELLEADIIVLASPMYNWSVPSVLKAYIDQVVRVNKTFEFNKADMDNPYIGLLQDKTVFLLLSRGAQGYEKGDHNEHLDFQSTYLKTVFNIIGVSNIHGVSVNGVSYAPEKLKTTTETSYQELKDLIDMEIEVV